MLTVRRLVSFAAMLLVFGSLFCVCGAGEPVPADISAASYIVVDDMGREIFSRLPDEAMPPASTAKLLTALVAAENCGMNAEITVTDAHVATEGSLMYLLPGERVTLNELLYGLLLASGNDAALAIADLVSGGEAEFAALMNGKARELGMNSSHFTNASGLPDVECYTTAGDMARLISEFCKNSALMEICGTREAVLDGRTVVNHNRLLSTVKGVDCGKTGFTKTAGRCLVSSAVRNGRRVFVVTLNAPDDWKDHSALYDAAFARYAKTELSGFLPVSQELVGGQSRFVRVVCSSAPVMWLSEAEIAELRSATYMRRFEYAPVELGATCGRTEIFCGDRLLVSVGLYYGESAGAETSAAKYLENVR